MNKDLVSYNHAQIRILVHVSLKTKYDIAEQVEPLNKKLTMVIKELLKKKKLNKERMLKYVSDCMSQIS